MVMLEIMILRFGKNNCVMLVKITVCFQKHPVRGMKVLSTTFKFSKDGRES